MNPRVDGQVPRFARVFVHVASFAAAILACTAQTVTSRIAVAVRWVQTRTQLTQSPVRSVQPRTWPTQSPVRSVQMWFPATQILDGTGPISLSGTRKGVCPVPIPVRAVRVLVCSGPNPTWVTQACICLAPLSLQISEARIGTVQTLFWVTSILDCTKQSKTCPTQHVPGSSIHAHGSRYSPFTDPRQAGRSPRTLPASHVSRTRPAQAGRAAPALPGTWLRTRRSRHRSAPDGRLHRVPPPRATRTRHQQQRCTTSYYARGNRPVGGGSVVSSPVFMSFFLRSTGQASLASTEQADTSPIPSSDSFSLVIDSSSR